MNRFFMYSDNKLENDTMILKLEPNFFWSRLFEYEFCKQFINKDDVILDAGCGTDSLFKFILPQLCKDSCGCDLENLSWDNIKNSIISRYVYAKYDLDNIKYLYDKINLSQCSMDDMSYENEKFDKIFCISVFEHMPKEIQIGALKEFYRVLKNNGKVILTCDYPEINPIELIDIINECGFKIYGDYDYTIYDNHIQSDYFGYNCKCFSMVLEKQ